MKPVLMKTVWLALAVFGLSGAAQARWVMPIEDWQVERSDRFLRLGKDVGQGRNINGEGREWRAGDLENFWVGEVKTVLKLRTSSISTKVRSRRKNFMLSSPWQPFEGHRLFGSYHGWEVRTDNFRHNGLLLGILPVKGKYIQVGDVFDWRSWEVALAYGDGTVHLAPPGRNKMHFETQRLTLAREERDLWTFRGILNRTRTEVVGTQWSATAMAEYRPPAWRGLFLRAGADALNDGIPLHDDHLGGLTSQLAFIYKNDPTLGPKVSSIYRKRTGVVWLALGGQATF